MKSIILLSALLFAGAASTSSPKAMYFNDFNSREECLEAAGALNREIAEEGITLLKNDGSLPFRGNEYVSVFGVRSDSLTGGSASVQESLKAAGFHVNPTLTTFYEEDSSSIGKERTDFNGTVKASMSTYSDAAFIVLSRAGGEGSDGLIVQGIGRSSTCLDDVSFVEFEFHFAGYVFLGLLDEGLHCFTQRSEPFSFIYDLSKLVAHVKLHGGGLAVKDQLFKLLMRLVQDGSAGSLINAAGFHADNAVFHDVHDADAVLAAQLVELADDIGNLHLLAVDGGGSAFFKSHGYIFGFIGRLFRSGAENQKMIIIGLVGRILKLQSFMTDVPQVAVTAVAGIRGEGKVDAMSLAVFDFRFTGIHGPLVASPGSDDFNVRSQSLDAELEADLVISLSGSAVADGDCAFLAGDFYQLLRYLFS